MFRGARHWHWQKPAENLLGTCVGPLAFSSRFKPLEGLMHLPLSCCEKRQGLRNHSVGWVRVGGEGGCREVTEASLEAVQ